MNEVEKKLSVSVVQSARRHPGVACVVALIGAVLVVGEARDGRALRVIAYLGAMVLSAMIVDFTVAFLEKPRADFPVREPRTEIFVAAAGQHAAAPPPLTLPAIRPGDTLAQVEALIGQPEFEGVGEHNLRSLNWHQTPMMIMVLVDDQGVVVSVMFQVKKGRRFITDDGVIVGRDTLRTAAAKIGERVIKRSEIGYVVDASCFGASITTKSKALDWVVTYESLECDEGEQSVEKLPRSPVNNVTIAARSLSQ